MSVLDECRRNFKLELRHFVGLQYTAADPVDIQRQRGRLRQLLTDVRSGAIAMSSAGVLPSVTTAASLPVSVVEHKRQPGKEVEKRAAARSESVSSTLIKPMMPSNATMAATGGSERRGVPPAQSSRREPTVDLDVVAVFAEECLAAAQYLLSRGAYKDVIDICLDPLEKDVREVLRGAAAKVEAARVAARAKSAGEPGAEKSEVRLQETEDVPAHCFWVTKAPAQPKELLYAWRLLAQYDMLRYTCQFYQAFSLETPLSDCSGTIMLAASHIEAMTSRLLGIAAVDPDDSYHILFNGCVTVYEMCLYMMRRAGGCVNEAVPHVLHHIALCLEICESAALKLATVRYLPWRLRLYDYLAACYEQQAMYSEALTVVQRAAQKVQELVDLEFLDPVPPPQASQDVMLRAMDHVFLNLMRYTWYVNSTTKAGASNAANATSGGVTESISTLKQPHSMSAAALGASTPLWSMMEVVPSSGLELLDRAWQLLLKVALPKRPASTTALTTSPSVTGKGGKFKEQKAKQKQPAPKEEVVSKDLVAGRVWESLLRFLLSLATASLPPSGRESQETSSRSKFPCTISASSMASLKQLRRWALEALEFVVSRATSTYVRTNPEVLQQGSPEEFAAVEAWSQWQEQKKQQQAAAANEAANEKKNGASKRRPNRAPTVVQSSIPAEEDESFLASITLERLLCNPSTPTLTKPSVPGGGDAEKALFTKQLHMEPVNEEALLFTLLLYRALYNGANAQLYGCLCTCSAAFLLQHYRELEEEEEEDARQGMHTTIHTSLKKVAPPSKKMLQVRLLDTVGVSLRLLRRMRRVSLGATTCIGDLAAMAQELERLTELYAGPGGTSVNAILQQNRKDTLVASALLSSFSTTPMLGTSTVLSVSFVAVYQGIMEECAGLLQERARAFAPSALLSASAVTPFPTNIVGTNKTVSHGGGVTEEGEEEELEAMDMYHRIVCAYLGAKVKSGLSDGVSIGYLVLAYVQEVEVEFSNSPKSASGGGEANGGDVGSKAAASSKASLSKDTGDRSKRFRVLDGRMHALRKQCNRARMALVSLRMALGCIAQSSAPLSAEKRSLKGSGSQLAASTRGTSAQDTIGAQEGEEDVVRIRREQEIRDMRTELTRWLVQLRWTLAILRQHYAVLEKHKSEARLVIERQANTKVYGATTMKEANVLESLLQAELEMPRVCEDEKGKLLAWARDEGDELLHALILMCLAPHEPQTKTQREMLEGAFHLLQRHATRRGQFQLTGSGTKPQSESAYSAFMVLCYAISTCGKLGFNNMTERAKDALYAAFSKSDKDDDEASDGQNAAVEASTTTAACELTDDPISMFLMHINEELLAVSSTLQLQTLVSALLWMSTVEARRIPYHNFDTTGLIPFNGKSFMMEAPFQLRYGLTKLQLWHMRSAYRIQFAVNLASRVGNSGQMLQCAFELFNTLLPSLTDENYYPFLLPPLATLCEALMRQPASTWGDAHVQLLAARTLDALLKTVQKMSAAGPDVESAVRDAAEVSNSATGGLTMMPVSIQGWYDLFLRLFARAWENVYSHPNPRQVRYQESLRRGARIVQRVLCLDQDGVDENTTPFPHPSLSMSRMSISKAKSLSVSAAAVAAGNTAVPRFPGGAYAVTDTILDDCVPIEFLELLGAILFTVPGGTAFLTQSAGARAGKSPERLRSMPAAEALMGVPSWLLAVAKALTGKTPSAAFDRLQQAVDDPLYAKTAVYIVEHLLQQGDIAAARRVATEALQTIAKLHQRVQDHQQAVVEHMTTWLENEGYMLVTPSRLNKKPTPEVPSAKGRRQRRRSVPRGIATEAVPPVGQPNTPFAGTTGRQWTTSEQQMLRQLTRGVAYVRRRQALRWLRGRIMQFNAPYQAQLHFYLSVIAQSSLEQRRQQQAQEGNYAAAPVTSQRQGHNRLKAHGEETAAAAALTRAEELKAEVKKEEECFIQHAARSALIFTRCGFCSRAFAVISQTIDGLRMFVCEEPPDMTLADEELLPPCHGPHNVTPRRRPSVTSLSFDSISLSNVNSNTMQMVAANEKLMEWGPRVLPLARALQRVLFLLWYGFVDYRRDKDFLHPAAVKVGRDVQLEEQLHFQGRVPSLHSYASAAGQYEEARLAHLAALNSARLIRSFEWRTREVQAAEQKGREEVNLQWLAELHELLVGQVSAGMASMGPHAAGLEKTIAKLVEQAESRVQKQSWAMMPTKAKKSSRKAELLQGDVPEPIRTGNADASALIALRLGSTIPAEKIVDNLMFLLRYMQVCLQLVSLELCLEVHTLTDGFFAYALLPFALTLQRTIGAARDEKLLQEDAHLRQNEPMHKLLVRNARRSWDIYTTTERYRRVLQRLARTLLPSRRNLKEPLAVGASFADTDTASRASLETPTTAKEAVVGGGGQHLALRDVLSRYEASTTYLQQRRLFGLLSEQLHEVGRIHLLHRQRAEAERCWIEAVDAALEVPDSLKRPPETWAKLPVATIGLPRLLLAIMSISSLAMYIYREQQGKAVDAYLLAARILERFFEQGTTSNFPRRLREFGGFTLEDLIVLPQLGNSMPALMPQVVHHMLFLAWELLRFKFPFYAAMVASLTEYFARTHMRHVASTVEARLVQAMAAAKFGSYKASMKILRGVCQGVRIPRGALDSTGLRVRALVECVEAVKPTKSKRGDGGAASSNRQADQQHTDQRQQEQQQPQQQQQQYESLEGLYNDAKLPLQASNVACIQTFLTQCLGAGSATAPNVWTSQTSSSTSPSILSGGGGGSVLHEAVVSCYGVCLSQRVELTIADVLVTLGAKEVAYVWSAFTTQYQPVSSDRRGGRPRSSQRVYLHGFANSACLEALNAAEQILQSLLARLQEKGASTATKDASFKRSTGQDNMAAFVPENTQSKRGQQVEGNYLRYNSLLLLARIYTARGDSSKALAMLRWLVSNFNENLGGHSPTVAATGAPSYLWTVATHIFWCDVYELMLLNHVRLREYMAAQQVIREAITLCEHCGDTCSGRVFSLYDAAIKASTGAAADARETLCVLQKMSHTVGSDNRIDMLHAWAVVAAESLRRVLHEGGQGQGETSAAPCASASLVESLETLETAVRALREYCEMYGLLPGSVPLLETRRLPALTEASLRRRRRPFVAWNVEAVFLHRALNLLAEAYMRVGKLEHAEGVLQHAIATLAPQYDITAHPTPLIESRFMLARVLCLLRPSLLTEQQPSAKHVSDTVYSEELNEAEVLNMLDPPRQRPVRLLMDVAEQVVVSGTHDYNILRLALLNLAVLLTRADRAFHLMAATCVILAKFVGDMNFHVFSGTSVFSLYGEDNLQLGTDLMFPESVTAVIESMQRSLGNVAEKDVSSGGVVSGTASPNLSSEQRRSPSRFREEKDESAQKNTIALPVLIAAFASLHLERAMQCVFPPPESLDLETALRLVRKYLQVKTSPLGGYYLWYDDVTREAYIRQQQQQQQHGQGQGRPGEGARAQRGSFAGADVGGAGISLLPPIVVDELPPLLATATIMQLGIPKVNVVLCQSFMRDVNGNFAGKLNALPIRSGASQARGASSSISICAENTAVDNSQLKLTFVLFVSPVYDPSATHSPPISDKVQHLPNKKALRPGAKPATGANDAKNLSVSTPIVHPWNGTRCVTFELPMEELQTLFAQAVQTLQLMQNPSAAVVVAGAEGGEEVEVPVEAALSQKLNEAMVLLTAKTVLPTGGRKVPRTGAALEFQLHSPLGATSSGASTARQGGIAGRLESGAMAAHDAAVADVAGEVPVVDEAKSKLVTGFIESLVRSVIPRAVTDDELMERCVDSLLPRCAVSVEVVRFLQTMMAGDGGSLSLFHPGLHEWFARVAKFVAEHA
ncbi:hypothetical protein TraAM80_07084 [Trypanosoma rangeli]|uniref:Uncharacterized protein n=1 Tax=Trypanosoma rangeli TaxID=5698 RepID=A0A3R7NDZ3_TRYRA|nr:uncharacterized protein TraAM80_07084 [Trypanosoma rangeli]RNF01283.1 hypothetical protein TraAM80_07084 [Trypanosoma rangeli]|eukprot:RNF01283.1 hypothetical protein TraAM80_07084 [Trypanosoma rangeli]